MTNPTINDVFDQLDRDRHLAGYRLEERASPFFKLFLPEVMKEYITPVNPLIIPELPFLKEGDTNRSPKVDFFALSDDGTHAFFIELKTDMNSERSEQDTDLEAATERSMFDILSDLTSIAQASDKQSRQKYFHLLHNLECLKLIKMDHTLKSVMFAENSQGVYDLIKAIEVKGSGLYPEIIYILPRTHDIPSSKVITFEQFAEAIKGCGEIGARFAKSLLEWARIDAGTQPPGANCP